MRLSYRNRLVLIFTMVIAATGGIATLVGAILIGERFVRQAQSKVAQDINSAKLIYEHELETVSLAVRMTSNRPHLREIFEKGKIDSLVELLELVRKEESLDFLAAFDEKGNILTSSGYELVGGRSNLLFPLVHRALMEKTVKFGTEVLSAEEMEMVSPGLAQRARIKLIPTPMASPTQKTEETSGMVLAAAAPVFGARQRLIGAIFGGKLLNHRNELVDRIVDTVYQGETYRGQKIGTATLFLGEVRIATTVRMVNGERAVGTLIQAEVGEAVLKKGMSWKDRAFVVNGWYLTDYEPIRNSAGQVVGVLYVGLREDKFVALKKQTIMIFLGLTMAGMLLAAVMAYFLARGVLRPIRALVVAAGEISNGNFHYRVEERSKDEFGILERAFNHMTMAIQERDLKIKEQTQARTLSMLAQADRLGALGRLVAGCVHEINNPLTGILNLLNLVQRTLDEEGVHSPQLESLRSYLEIAKSETIRCSNIVGGLLDFSRQSKLELAEYDVNEVIERSLSVISRQLSLSNIVVVKELDRNIPRILLDVGKTQQCILNLVINAMEAMEGGGTLTIKTECLSEQEKIVVTIKDTGQGIAPENLPRIFDPFFTTKGSKGLGLGLSVAYGVVHEHGGNIEVESEPGHGTTFRIYFPVKRASVCAEKKSEEKTTKSESGNQSGSSG